MSYAAAIRTSGAAEVFTHNKESLAPDNSFIVGYAPKPELTLWQFLGKASVQELRDVFMAAVNPKGQDYPDNAFVLMHAVDPSSQVVDTNSKLAKLHIHSFTSDFSEEFAHIQETRSWVSRPNPNLPRSIETVLGNNSNVESDTYHLPKSDAEAQRHIIFSMPAFVNVFDLMDRGSDEDVNSFRAGLKSIITPFINGERKGGARLIIDERGINDKGILVQALGGENLDRTGEGLRYFENPAPKPPA